MAVSATPGGLRPVEAYIYLRALYRDSCTATA